MLDISLLDTSHILRKKRSATALPIAVLYDNFNSGANDATLAGRAPLVGPNANTWAVTNTFVSNAGRAEARFPSTGNALLRFNTGLIDIDVSVDFILPTTGNNRSAGILFHYVNSNNYLYTLANLDNSVFRILAFIGGTPTVLVETPYSFTAGVSYRMRLVYVADRIFSTIEGIGTLPLDLAEYDSENSTTLVSTFGAATVHGLRGSNQTGQGAIIFDNIHFVDPPPVADVFITTSDTPLRTSTYISSINYTHNEDVRLAPNATARNRAMGYLSAGFDLHCMAICGSFGAGADPFGYIGADDGTGPYPTKNANQLSWTTVDAIANWITSMGHEPVVTLYNFPWWTRGRDIWSGGEYSHTDRITYAERFSDDGRPITEMWSYCETMIRSACRRYLAPPFNFRWFCTGVEFHGFERARDGGFLTLGYDLHEGTPGRADMGFAFVHNRIYAILKEEADALGIARNEYQVIPNYPRTRSRGVGNSSCYSIGHPLRNRVWGSIERYGPDSILLMYPLLSEGSYDYWCYDVGALNAGDGVEIAGWFENNIRYTEIHAWIRDELASLGITVPGFVREIYAKPNTDPGDGQQQLRGAIYADAFGRLIKEGAKSISIWSPIGRAHKPGNEFESGMVTLCTTSTGGEAQPAYYAVKMYHDWFGEDTPIYDATVSGTGVNVYITDEKAILVNVSLTDNRLVNLDNATYTLAPNEFLVVDR